MKSYVCQRCGAAFTSDKKTTAKWSPKFCGPVCRYATQGELVSAKFNDPVYAAKMARISSDRMRRRRNGGDPKLNAILSKAASEHLKRLWANPEWAAAQIGNQLAKVARLNADPKIDAKKRKAARWIMSRASRRLARNAEWRELMSVKTSEYMATEPWRQDIHGDYAPNYLSMICTKVQADAEVAAFRNTRMAEYIQDAAAVYRQERPQ